MVGKGRRVTAGGIVQAQTPEEREYARYLVEVEARKRRVAELQADIEARKVALARFNAEYHARVGTLFIELDRVRLAIDEYEQRIAWLKANPTADPEQVERDIADQFEARRQEVRNEEQENRRYEEAFQRERERPQLASDEESRIKTLYRELAKRFHPDLARTEEERQRRLVVMQRINKAFTDRDIDQLTRISHEAEFADPAFESRSIGEKLVWAIREVARLEEVAAFIEDELVRLQASELYGLWQRQDVDASVLNVLEADLRREITEGQGLLATLVSTYRQLLALRERP
jgi:hypothetical protein